MAVRVKEFHHSAVRVPRERAAEVIEFYRDVLGLSLDPSRPELPDVPGAWFWVGAERRSQLHVVGVDPDKLGPGVPDDVDPTRPHVALAVDDIAHATAELERRNVAFRTFSGLIPGLDFIFLHDPAGNMVELHQADVCTCNAAAAGQRVTSTG